MPPILCTPSNAPAAAPAVAWGLALIGLGALCSTGAVLAQDSLARLATRDAALAAAGVDGSPARANFELITLRNNLLAPGVALANADVRAASELAGVSYRVWTSGAAAAIGVGVGTLGYVLPASGGRIDAADAPRYLTGAVPTLSVALRMRVSAEHSFYADASSARGLGPDANQAYYSTKVGVEWKPAGSTLGLDHGAVGMRFDSGYRLSVKPRRGGAAVYVRGQF